VAVEYFKPNAAQNTKTDDDRPSLFGRPVRGPSSLESGFRHPHDGSDSGAMDGAALLVIPFVDEDAPDNVGGVLRDAYEMVDRLAASAFGLRAYVLEDRAAVSELARRIGLRPTMATNGVFVTIAFVDADEPTRPLHDAAWLADVFQRRGIPAVVVADPSTIDLVIEGLDATYLDM
jgi:hypothetical protein